MTLTAAPKRSARVREFLFGSPWRIAATTAVVALVVVLLVLLVRSATKNERTFSVPSAGMEPTIKAGGDVTVDLDADCCKRGDIVVFASSPNPEWERPGVDFFVKRVIALPGETIAQCDGEKVCIDGKVLDESYVPDGTPSNFPSTLPTLGDGKNLCGPDSPAGGCTLPAGTVFVLGDNRTNSADSRAYGPITVDSVVGVRR
jgi:signal peptidase I